MANLSAQSRRARRPSIQFHPADADQRTRHVSPSPYHMRSAAVWYGQAPTPLFMRYPNDTQIFL